MFHPGQFIYMNAVHEARALIWNDFEASYEFHWYGYKATQLLPLLKLWVWIPLGGDETNVYYSRSAELNNGPSTVIARIREAKTQAHGNCCSGRPSSSEMQFIMRNYYLTKILPPFICVKWIPHLKERGADDLGLHPCPTAWWSFYSTMIISAYSTTTTKGLLF